MPKKVKEANRYAQILEHIFAKNFDPASATIQFEREEIFAAANELGIDVPKNVGDIIYSFRYRNEMPAAIAAAAPSGKVWVIKPAGRARYVFAAVDPSSATILPNERLLQIKIPNATPGLIEQYALTDEQALLAVVRYNRLVDVFTGVMCYSLQSHLRTTVDGIGQVETDEIYVGIDKHGAHYVLPMQAKGGTDVISTVQIGQDIAVCSAKFPDAECRPLAAQFIDADLVALFEFAFAEGEVVVVAERHYRLAAPDEISAEDLLIYGRHGVD